MTCRVVSKASVGGKPETKDGVLSEDERAVIQRHISGESLSDAGRSTRDRALGIVEQREDWLAVVDEQGTEKLYTVVNRNGRLHLRCFAREHSKDYVGDSAEHRALPGLILNFHRAFGVGSDDPPENTPDKREERERNDSRRLGSFLYQLLEESGLTVWKAPFPSGRAANRVALGNAARRFFLADGIAAEQLFFEDYTKQKAKEATRRLISLEESWPEGGRPYALFAVVANELNEDSILAVGRNGNARLRVAGILRRPGVPGTRGPFLVLFTYSKDRATNTYQAIKAFAVPVLSVDCWLPVESNHERRYLLPIQQLVERLARGGREVVLRKPMLDILYPNERRYVRPDVLLEAGKRLMVIEILGFDDKDYLERKKSQAEVIRRHAVYHDVKAFGDRGISSQRLGENALLAKIGSWLSTCW